MNAAEARAIAQPYAEHIAEVVDAAPPLPEAALDLWRRAVAGDEAYKVKSGPCGPLFRRRLLSEVLFVGQRTSKGNDDVTTVPATKLVDKLQRPNNIPVSTWKRMQTILRR